MNLEPQKWPKRSSHYCWHCCSPMQPLFRSVFCPLGCDKYPTPRTPYERVQRVLYTFLCAYPSRSADTLYVWCSPGTWAQLPVDARRLLDAGRPLQVFDFPYPPLTLAFLRESSVPDEQGFVMAGAGGRIFRA